MKKVKRNSVGGRPLAATDDLKRETLTASVVAPFRPQRGGDVAQLKERQTGTLLAQVRFSGRARNFSPEVNFQCRHSYGVRTPPCATAFINICAHVKDSIVHVRDRWIMETLKHTACTAGWVARLSRSWLSPGKASRICHGRNPTETIQL